MNTWAQDQERKKGKGFQLLLGMAHFPFIYIFSTKASESKPLIAQERKKAKEAELLELEKLFGKAIPAKKGGATMMTKKGKVDPKEKAKKADLHVDRRDEEKNKTMEGWTEEELRAAIEKKHGKSNKNAATTTDKICNHFLQAVEDNK